MIDEDARKSLSEDLRRLIAGRMSNDQFDEVYYRQYADSRDRAVIEIATFAYSLYSSDLLLPYRLRGRHAVGQAVREAAARSVLFLRSGLEYKWPPSPDNPGLRVLAGAAFSFGIPAGIALLLIGMSMFADGWDHVVGSFTVLGALLLISSTALCRLWPRSLDREWQAFNRAGDYELWPFLRRQDFENAQASCHLLGRS
jgi:hypothetical protein